MDLREEARRYCSLVEAVDTSEQAELAAALAESLARVIAAASARSDVAPTGEDLPDGPSHEEWGERCGALWRGLGDWVDYWTTTEAHGNDAGEAVPLQLWDDLADVWRDLERGLRALDGGTPVEDVVWQWRFDFYAHWGRHATEALRALHARLAAQGGPPRRGVDEP